MQHFASRIVCKSGALIVQEGKLLLVRKAGLDWWILPGGKLESGESPEVALKREIGEELQCGVASKRFIGLYLDDWIERSNEKIAILAFHAELEGEPIISDEIVEMRWFTEEEVFSVPKIASGARSALRDLLAGSS